ncbi:hypothetical protein BGZ75_010026 [Mortierella antarctica]|nr:hypothetical protein BGZ75_010026 [Mortierella antarctica]
MHPSFILPPSIKTQAQDKRRKRPAAHPARPSAVGKPAWKPTWSDTRHAALTNAQPPRHAIDPVSSQASPALASTALHSQSTPSLKRKLDAATPEDHDTWTTLASEHDTLSSQHQHLATAHNVSSQLVGHSGGMEALSASGFESVASSRSKNSQGMSSLADRGRLNAPEVSRRLSRTSSSHSGTSSHAHQRSRRPSAADTIPTLADPVRQTKTTKNIKSSEFAKSIILPTVDPTPSTLKSKREKFAPPLVRGGYAERLASLVGYHKSEYVMWANATLRRDKLFGSTEPLAVVSIKEIFRENHLQWTRCSVICSVNNKPPFDVVPERRGLTHANNTDPGIFSQGGRYGSQEGIDVDIVEGGGSSQEAIDVEIVKSTPDPNTVVLHSVESSFASQFIGEEDSISGLHLNMGDMAVVSCTPETDLQSVVENASRNHAYRSIFDDSIVSIIEEGDEARAPFLNLKSSQGSDDEFEEASQIRNSHQSGVHVPLIVLPEPVGEIRLQCLDKDFVYDANDENKFARRHSAQDDIERATSAITSATDQSLYDGAEPASVISSIDDRTWSSTSAPVVMCTPVEDLFSQDHNIPTQGSITASGQRRNVESEANFVIAFSNLFSWSTLKVSDLVEIHEPCRHIAIQMDGSDACGRKVWIAERYKIVSTL